MDTEVITQIMKNNPLLKGKTPYGDPKSLLYGLDKWQTWLFTQKYNLPFAESFVMNRSGGTNELKQFVEKFGFPLIAKPIHGFASKGVFFNEMDGATPLFSETPNVCHYTCQNLINPNGKIEDFFITKNIHKSGATVEIQRVKNSELENIAMLYAKAYVDEGGYGPFGVQFRKDRNGEWKGQEII